MLYRFTILYINIFLHICIHNITVCALCIYHEIFSSFLGPCPKILEILAIHIGIHRWIVG